MGISFPALLCARETGSGSFPLPDGLGATQERSHVSAPYTERELNSLRGEAEAAFEKGALLRGSQTQTNLRSAIVQFQMSARFFKTAHSQSGATRAYLQIGETRFILSEYNQALRSYLRVLSLSGTDLSLQCQALSGLARTYATVGQSSEANRYSQQAVDVCEGIPSLKLQADALEARGEALSNSNDAVQGTVFLRQAQERFAQAHDDDGQALALLNLSYARFPNDYGEGVRLAGQAMALWAANKNGYGVARARGALGFFAVVTGEWETGKCNYALALPAFRGIGDQDSEAAALDGLGKLNLKIGDAETSLKNYQLARTIFARLHDYLGSGEAISGMVDALSRLQRYPELLRLYSSKLPQVRKAKNRAQEASLLADMADVYRRKRKYVRAEALYRGALEIYHSIDQSIGESDALIRLAELKTEQRNYMQAIALLESALPLKEKNAQPEDMAQIYYELAYIYRRLNRLEIARSAIEKTIVLIESQRIRIAQFDSRASYFASVHRYYALYIQVLMLLHREHPNGDFARRAFDAAEKSKVRSLLDLLTNLSQDAPCEELLNKQLTDLDAPDIHASRLAAIPAAVDDSTVTLEQVQAEIGSDDTVLLEYAFGDEKSYLWVVDQKQIVAHELPGAAQIRKVALAFRDTIAPLPLRDKETGKQYQTRLERANRAYPFYARQLSRLLLGPAALAHAKRLLIVPDGPLQYVPLAALPLPVGHEEKTILISHHEVVVLPSASALSILRKAAAKRAPPTLVAAIFADPVYGRDDERMPFTRVSGKKKQDLPSTLTRAIQDMNGSFYIPRLMGSAEEGKAILGILGKKNVFFALGFDASRANVLKDGLGSYRLIHFATHGKIDTLNPEMSGLILSLINESGKRQDGYLRLGDIYNLKLSADLVVLSSCDSALGKDLDSEGTIGLPRGFLYAGAKSVIASLWKVNDDATGKLMGGIYARMQRGESPSSALRGAQLEMAMQGASPSVWAAFVLQGDYK